MNSLTNAGSMSSSLSPESMISSKSVHPGSWRLIYLAFVHRSCQAPLGDPADRRRHPDAKAHRSLPTGHTGLDRRNDTPTKINRKRLVQTASFSTSNYICADPPPADRTKTAAMPPPTRPRMVTDRRAQECAGVIMTPLTIRLRYDSSEGLVVPRNMK